MEIPLGRFTPIDEAVAKAAEIELRYTRTQALLGLVTLIRRDPQVLKRLANVDLQSEYRGLHRKVYVVKGEERILIDLTPAQAASITPGAEDDYLF